MADKADKADTDGIYIDGQTYTIADLTFKERRSLRKTVADLTDGGELEDQPEENVLPVFVWVVKKRVDPEYNMDQALELKASDLEAPADPPKRRASTK